MSNDIDDRLQALEEELAEIKTVQRAAEDMRRQVEQEPHGLDRLRGVNRKTGYPTDNEND